eukprot:scaffold314036_cov14-Tisochrysis_lutea.AAC.1
MARASGNQMAPSDKRIMRNWKAGNDLLLRASTLAPQLSSPECMPVPLPGPAQQARYTQSACN